MSVSNEEHNEYMRNVKWTTALYSTASTISVVVAIVWFCAGLKSDIKDTRIESKEQIASVSSHLSSKIDSNQHQNDLQFQALWLELNRRAPLPEDAQQSSYRPRKKRPKGTGFVYEQWVNGKLQVMPVNPSPNN